MVNLLAQGVNAAKTWEHRWVRFRLALAASGVEPRMHDYCRGWILGFLKFIKPRRNNQAQAKDVENFLAKLRAESRKDWQVRQADEALRIFFTEVAATREARGVASEDRKAGYAAHAQAFVRHAFARRGCGHTHRARAARAFRRKHHNDLHACARARTLL
jgi:hypothetical protein